MNELDKKLNEVYSGKVVRKDLLHRIKKGTNVPSFVLEFLLSKYCASDDSDEIEAGIQAVFETLENNYVRPDEANKAQSTVQQKGKHKFIDKVHVTYNEKEKRHWAEMDNFGSRRIAVPEKFYRNNDRLLEGGVWAEVTVCHNDIDEDDYAFYIEKLRPIQLSRFDVDEFCAGRQSFSRDEWIDVIIRSIGLEPDKLDLRLKFHFLARLIPFVEANYNFIELGPRGTGKSYAFSEFSPYATLVSQASTPTLFYNNARRKVGLVGFWDIVAFDEVARVQVKDKETVDIMKTYMASGRFSRGVEVIANASLAFVGNIDYSIKQLVDSDRFDLFIPLPEAFDLAVIDRFFTYLPGWEMPKNSSTFLTDKYGFITDYLAEAFHVLSKGSRYDYVNNNCRLGSTIQGRDEIAVKKTVAALLKLLHPGCEPSREELEEYMAYALEGRRRIKEQLNKRKHDDEFADINLSYVDSHGKEIIVWCPESKSSDATQNPVRKKLSGTIDPPAEVSDKKTPSAVTKAMEIISGGETATVEFKSSLRWSVKENCVAKQLQWEVIKAISGFMNTTGGKLFIGVHDDGEIYGLENDFKTLGKRQNRDGFLQTLCSAVASAVGSHNTALFNTEFLTINDKDICLITVEHATSHVFAKKGNSSKFFVRNGTTTVELDAEQTLKYIKKS